MICAANTFVGYGEREWVMKREEWDKTPLSPAQFPSQLHSSPKL